MGSSKNRKKRVLHPYLSQGREDQRHFDREGRIKAVFRSKETAYANAATHGKSRQEVTAYHCTVGVDGRHWHWGHKHLRLSGALQ